MKTTFENFLIYNLLENTNSDKYIVELNEDSIKELIDKHCKISTVIPSPFYRGDRSLNSDYYLINSKKTVNQIYETGNYILAEFASSDLWEKAGYPLKRSSLDMTTSFNTARMYGEPYVVIPFDNAKMVEVKFLLGNYITPTLSQETHDTKPSNLCIDMSYLISDMDITPNNIKEAISKIAEIYDDNNTDEELDEDILNGMEKHNMKFVDYMEYLFAPSNYNLITYDDNFKLTSDFDTVWTDSPVLLIKQSKYNEIYSTLSKIIDDGDGDDDNELIQIYDNKVVYDGRNMSAGKFINKYLRKTDINKNDIQMGDNVKYNDEIYTYKAFIMKYIVPILK